MTRAMTEEEWLDCTDPEAMLSEILMKSSARKLRLFACACLRRQWDRLPDEDCRTRVEAAELFADGLADRQEMADTSPRPPANWLARAVSYATLDSVELV